MILVDSSVWIDHLRRREPGLVILLEQGMVLTHPAVIGEIALGSITQRAAVLEAMRDLATAKVAADDEVAAMIERCALHGLGIGYVDVHLLAAVRLTPGAMLWTRDRRLDGVARRLGIAADLATGQRDG